MKVVYLSGGVGGARLCDGMAQAMPAEDLTAIVNVGDDFTHLGLVISPDIDSMLYTLSGLGDEARGWGLSGESFRALAMLARHRPEEAWFQLGDQDLGTHFARTRWLAEGATLTEVTARLARGLGVAATVLPASDGALRTVIDTEMHGELPFQEWLVKHRAPAVRGVRFVGDGALSQAALAALERAELIVIGPSNPYVSIDPIAALPGLRDALCRARGPVIAVSPIVAGRAVKGPLAEMIPKLAGRAPSAAAIAAHYRVSRGIALAGLVVEHGDDEAVRAEHPELAVRAARTVMRTRPDRRALAEETLALGRELRGRAGR